MDYFDGQSTSTPNFTYWLGLTDNSASCTGGCFYQAGLDWYDNTYLGLCDSYVGFILDSISGLTTPNNCILGTQQWTATQITSGSETIWLFLYNGQWYSAFSGSAESGYAPSGAIGAPGGADSATAVSGRAGAISEGWTNSGYTNYGEDLGSKIQYVTSVSLSGGIFTLSFTDATTSISDYYQASGTGYISPPSTANWYVGGSCPYTYESYFYSGGPGLPSSSSLSAC